MNTVEFDNVWKYYGRGEKSIAAVGGLDVRIGQGRMVAVMGPSGSGKTTFLNLAAGLDQPSRGDVRLMGQSLAAMSETRLADVRRRHVGFVFQTLNLLPILTAGENIELPLALNDQGARERAIRVAELLVMGGLSDRAESLPVQLSQGEQQRIAVLRSVAHRPGVVFMDEPTSALDTQRTDELMDLMLRINEREQTTFVVTTHDRRVADRFHEVMQLVDGRLWAAERNHHD
jgi:putative ABC transport system ATP-binding protein